MLGPLPESGILEFGRFITEHHWLEVIEENDVNKKAEAFHMTIRSKFEEIFPKFFFYYFSSRQTLDESVPEKN